MGLGRLSDVAEEPCVSPQMPGEGVAEIYPGEPRHAWRASASAWPKAVKSFGWVPRLGKLLNSALGCPAFRKPLLFERGRT